MKTVDLYIRVSTDEQADKGYSQRNQEEVLRKYCENNSLLIRKILFEDYSAKTFQRPQWNKYLSDLKRSKGKSDALLFTKWDRFSRNAADAYQMINILRMIGVEPQAIEQPLDLTIPENKMMLAFYLAAPEVENDRRALNVLYGMRRAKKEGRWMATAPFGYINKTTDAGKKFIGIKEPESNIVKWAFEEVSRGIIFPDQIRKELNRKGFGISRSAFYNLLRNPVYCGKIFIPALKNEESSIVPGLHEPIISDALFNKVQRVLEGNKRKARKELVQLDTNPEFPMRGFLICPDCSRMLTGSTSKGRGGFYHYYHCNLGCKCRFKTEIVHTEFEKELKRLLPHRSEGLESLAEVLLLNLHKAYGNQRQDNSRQLMDEIRKQNDRLSKARELLLSDDIDATEFKIMKMDCEKRIIQLESDLTDAKSNYSSAHSLELLFKRVVHIIPQLDTLYHTSSTAKKREIIGSIYPEKLVFDGKAYRTPRVNEAIRLIRSMDKSYRGNKNGNDALFLHHSRRVVPTGIEPVSKV
ncbi:recombinase family protein [Sediminibacterium sp.]|uniref:recombinase family protein n=1 Tax=Sediminibacterium sp. TaxID=1917865 RepID=UPI003A100561